MIHFPHAGRHHVLKRHQKLSAYIPRACPDYSIVIAWIRKLDSGQNIPPGIEHRIFTSDRMTDIAMLCLFCESDKNQSTKIPHTAIGWTVLTQSSRKMLVIIRFRVCLSRLGVLWDDGIVIGNEWPPLIDNWSFLDGIQLYIALIAIPWSRFSRLSSVQLYLGCFEAEDWQRGSTRTQSFPKSRLIQNPSNRRYLHTVTSQETSVNNARRVTATESIQLLTFVNCLFPVGHSLTMQGTNHSSGESSW
jgi:hypothetical protein